MNFKLRYVKFYNLQNGYDTHYIESFTNQLMFFPLFFLFKIFPEFFVEPLFVGPLHVLPFPIWVVGSGSPTGRAPRVTSIGPLSGLAMHGLGRNISHSWLDRAPNTEDTSPKVNGRFCHTSSSIGSR
jgi:hypothetical protein